MFIDLSLCNPTAVTLIRILKDGRGRSEPERRSGPTAPEPAGFLDGYPGTEPLIGEHGQTKQRQCRMYQHDYKRHMCKYTEAFSNSVIHSGKYSRDKHY